jgi:hypothetical protein
MDDGVGKSSCRGFGKGWKASECRDKKWKALKD